MEWLTFYNRCGGIVCNFTILQKSACNLRFRNPLFLEFSVSGYAENKIMNNRGQSYIVFESHNFIPESITLRLLSQVILQNERCCNNGCESFVQNKSYVYTNMLTWNGFISGRKTVSDSFSPKCTLSSIYHHKKVLKVFLFIFFLCVT